MDCTVNANITPTAAVRLLIMNEIDIDGFWQTKQAEHVLGALDNCVPKKVLQNYFVKKNIAVPICATCNLVYIPKSENRGKGDLTYYQKQQKDASTYTLNADALEALSYPRKKDLAFVESVSTLTAKNYFIGFARTQMFS